MTEPVQDPVETTRMSFFDHLEELRRRVWRSAIATGLMFILATTYADDCMRIVVAPYQDAMRDLGLDPTLKYASPTQPFVTWFKVSLFVSLIFSAPYWVAQIWGFISAGLYDREKGWVRKIVPFSVALFVSGVVFGYKLLLPIALRYMVGFAPADIAQSWVSLDEYLSLFATLTLLLGVTFLLPLLMIGIAKVGFVDPDGYRSYRRVTILVIFIVSGILTPPDPITQSLVAIPLCFLYEVGIILSAIATGKGLPSFKPADVARNLRIPVAIALLLWVMREPLTKSWRKVDADGKVETVAKAVVPWPEVGGDILGVVPSHAFRLSEGMAGRDFVVVGGGRFAVVRFKLTEDSPVVVNRRADGATWRAVRVQAGAVVWRAEMIADLKLSDILPKLRNALEVGARESFDTAIAVLDAVDPSGVTVPPAADAELGEERRAAALKRLDGILASRGSEVAGTKLR